MAQQITAQTPPPTEEKLRNLLMNDCVDLALDLINRHKMPYIVVEGQLRSAFTQGELYLQQFITTDKDTLEMKDDALKMSKSPYEVLISGETGTGKELIAKAMIGDRKGSIKSVNCAGFPRELIESELFGYKAGSFSGSSTRDQDGLMMGATDGIMFMDEVGELPMDVQAKFLRALQDKTIRKVGGKQEEKINCKFVCATNRDLRKMVEDGLFRKDLYARISTLELHIQPLKKRECDVVPITQSLIGGKVFLERYEKELREGLFDLSLNVRSLQQHVIRYNVLGRVKIER